MSNNIYVIDFSVICHNIYGQLSSLSDETLLYALDKYKKSNTEKENLDLNWVSSRYVVLLWHTYLLQARPGLDLADFIPVCVGDRKPYWRNFFYPEYKEGRPPKTREFLGVRDLGERVTKKLGIPHLSYLHYEADDVAAGIVKTHLLTKLTQEDFSKNKIYLYTVDTDWMQLISEGVTWVNTARWEPVIRDIDTYNVYIKKKFKREFEHPQDIVPHKCVYGDKSDNLPPGTPPYLIDLLNPHPEWNLLETNTDFLQTVLSLDKAKKASSMRDILHRCRKELTYFP